MQSENLLTGCPDFYSDFEGRSKVVVPVPEIGYNSDSEQYRSGYAHFKSFSSQNPSSNYGFLSIGWNFYHIFSGTMIIAVVLLLASLFFIQIKE